MNEVHLMREFKKNFRSDDWNPIGRRFEPYYPSPPAPAHGAEKGGPEGLAPQKGRVTGKAGSTSAQSQNDC